LESNKTSNRIALLQSESLTASKQEALATDPSPDVRINFAAYPKLNDSILTALLKDNNYRVKATALISGYFSEQTFHLLLQNASLDESRLLYKNPNLPTQLALKLAVDSLVQDYGNGVVRDVIAYSQRGPVGVAFFPKKLLS